jgi:nifR3 family TIM-barrel protein
MDGVTDAPYRFITAKHGKPDVHFTEFTNVEGLSRDAMIMLDDFLYSEIERPIVAQIYGSEPESFYKIAIVACALGFDGIDINMGCPAKKVASRGCGAGLIRHPSLAKKIILAVKQGVADWVDGKSPEELKFRPRMLLRMQTMNEDRIGSPQWAPRRAIPVSVKTRIGYDHDVIEDWAKHLLEVEPAVISIHGRTLKQMYTGVADWDAIARAAEIIRQTKTLVFGNGDITTLADMLNKIRASGVDGVLLGRGALGNPWIFSQKDEVKALLSDEDTPMVREIPTATSRRFEVLLEHAQYFEKVKGTRRFPAMRKHFGWYCKGMPQAAQLRDRMCHTSNSQEVAEVLADYRRQFPEMFANENSSKKTHPRLPKPPAPGIARTTSG